MKIIKENFYTVIKLWLNQFAAMFLSALLLLPAASLDGDWPLLAVSIFTTLFYLVLIFWVSCELGLKDNVPIEMGRMKRKWYKGTVLSLTANSLSILASIVACISKLFIPGVSFLGSTDGIAGTAANVYFFPAIINEILHPMYRGMILYFGLGGRIPFIYLPVALLSIVVCTLGYLAGSKGMFASLLAKNSRE